MEHARDGADDAGSSPPQWHALDAEAALRAVAGDRAGLGADEAASRLRRGGPNRLPSPRGRGTLGRLLAQFRNTLILVLLGAAVLVAFLGEWVEFWVILGVVAVNTLVGFVQEGRAEQALAAIRHLLAVRASVLRDGDRLEVDAAELVPGDLVLLDPGDKVPADLRLLEVKGLRILEAALTGESTPVEKSETPVAADAALADRDSMAYSGTVVAGGQGAGVVVATGAATEVGRVSGMLAEVEQLTTPLLEQMSAFSRRIALFIVGAALLLFLYGNLVMGHAPEEMFMIAVSLAVAAIPEGLPVILTLTLAIGVQRMAARNAIIRRLPAVETLGAVSIICTDKTGTLTRNEMTVRTVAAGRCMYTVDGTGYAPRGSFRDERGAVDPAGRPPLAEMLRAGALCNDSSVYEDGGRWSASGDPMESALLVAALKAGMDDEDLRRRHSRRDLIPFDAAHRYMAVLVDDGSGGAEVLLKGAPEQVLPMCTRERGEDGGEQSFDAAFWRRWVEDIAARGQRVLAVARRDADAGARTLDFDDVGGEAGGGLVLLGLFGLIDPPREDAAEAIAECRSAGIDVKMITGDHAVTAGAIARQLGLGNSEEIYAGRDLDRLDDEEFSAAALRADVFARTSPQHKLRLVEALQAQGEVVAMTGDGVNDAPALRRADVGVAMGGNGTEAAKEVADMVLADDNFVSIARAVREGRTVYANFRKAVLFLLPMNGGESLGIVVAVLAGLTLPITPLQILWVNMVSSVGLTLTLAVEPAEPDVMRRPPRPRHQPILSGHLVWRIAFVSVLFLCGIFGMYFWALATGATLPEARTHAANALVAMEVFYLFNVRLLDGSSSAAWKRLFGSRIVWAALGVVISLQLVFTYAPFMNRWFETRPVDLVHSLEILAVGSALFALLEAEKWIRERYRGRRGRRDGREKPPEAR